MLNLMDNPRANPAAARLADIMIGCLMQVLEAAIPSLRRNTAIADRIAADLETMGLLSGGGLHVTMTGSGLKAQRTTPLGRLFLEFIANPEDR